jgi:hypothetical protein
MHQLHDEAVTLLLLRGHLLRHELLESDAQQIWQYERDSKVSQQSHVRPDGLGSGG